MTPDDLAAIRAMIESIMDARGFPKLPSKSAIRQKRYRDRIKERNALVTNRNDMSVTNRNAPSRKSNGHDLLNGQHRKIGEGDLVATVPSLVGDIEVRKSFVMELIEAYPAVLVAQEVDRAKLWLDANPAKRKKNVRRFLTNWMARAQERGGTR